MTTEQELFEKITKEVAEGYYCEGHDEYILKETKEQTNDIGIIRWAVKKAIHKTLSKGYDMGYKAKKEDDNLLDKVLLGKADIKGIKDRMFEEATTRMVAQFNDEYEQRIKGRLAQDILGDFNKASEKWKDQDGWLDIGQEGEPPTPLNLQIKFHKFMEKYLPIKPTEESP